VAASTTLPKEPIMIETTTAAEATVLRGFAAFATRDMDTLGVVFHPEVVWIHHNDDRFKGAKAGWPAVAAFFGESGELTAGTLHVEPTTTMSSGDLVTVLARVTATRPDGRLLDDQQVLLFRLEDGRAVQVDQYIGEPAAVEAFWA
jgi:ketosteroid isomerase-like protein